MRPNQSAISLRQDDSCSFDHLVGAGEQRRRYVEAKRTRGRKIDDELEFGGLHHGQVGGLSALEDAASIDAKLPKYFRKVRSVAHQTADLRELSHIGHGRNRVAR